MYQRCFRSVVVITCASHAQGRRFEPGRKQLLFFVTTLLCLGPEAKSGSEDFLCVKTKHYASSVIVGAQSSKAAVAAARVSGNKELTPPACLTEWLAYHVTSLACPVSL